MQEKDPQTNGSTVGATPGETQPEQPAQVKIDVPKPKLEMLGDHMTTIAAHAVPARTGDKTYTWVPRVVITFNDPSDEKLRLNIKQFGLADVEDLTTLRDMIDFALNDAKERIAKQEAEAKEAAAQAA